MLRRLHLIQLPALWLVVDAFSFRFPGDEYGGFGASSLPGLWILPLIGDSGSPSRLLPYILMAGCATMAALGLVMDWLRTPPIPWAMLAILIAAALGMYELSQFPSWERAMAKNGSLQAYVFPVVSLGLLGSSLLMIGAMSLVRLSKPWRAPGAKPSPPTEPGEV